MRLLYLLLNNAPAYYCVTLFYLVASSISYLRANISWVWELPTVETD